MPSASPAVQRKTYRAPGVVAGLVFDIDKFAIHDGPGIRTTVFLKGCPLRCLWCHSPESQYGRPQLLYVQRKCTGCQACIDTCPETAIGPGSVPVDAFTLARTLQPVHETDLLNTIEIDWARCTQCGDCVEVCYPGALRMCGTWRTADEVVQEVAKDEAFFRLSGGGVTLTGGEVTQQSEFAYEVLRGCKARGIHTAVETAGLAPWRIFERLAEVTDLFLYDVKHMDPQRHLALTGVPNGPILDNLRRLAAHTSRGTGSATPPLRIIVRVPCITGQNDAPANIAATAAYLREIGVAEVHLLPYNASAAAKYEWIGQGYSLPDLQTQHAETMQTLAALCAAQGLQVQIGG